jgi:hypothetical protein
MAAGADHTIGDNSHAHHRQAGSTHLPCSIPFLCPPRRPRALTPNQSPNRHEQSDVHSRRNRRRRSRRSRLSDAADSAQQSRPRTLNGATASHAPADGIALPSTLLDITPQQAGTQTLLRGLAILEAAAAGVRDLRSIGAALGTTRSTTHRLVSSLVQARYLRQVQGGYLLGPKLIELGTIALEQMPLTAVARPHLASARRTHARHHPPRRARRRRRALHRQDSRHARPRNALARGSPDAAGIDGIGKAMMLDLRPRRGEAGRSVASRARRRELQAR